ncbi:NAD(P)H-binding protein [Actinophytocola sp.]|uniref:NAD(P)H-binding protein n=1 Tax=Actinophytocola sp. TaxID=1872138 RepID=UPI002D8077F8|nr:NAD(P)H-binding protein [Actinophytocola sp.]HET9141265.1 NAD(P)H-binding protein [Actinophytocola sp.]
MIVVTAASGHLGRLVIEALLESRSPDRIVAAARSPHKLADLADRGVAVRPADYDDPASLKAALAGADRLLLISADTPGKRVAQHRNAVDAAVAAGVGHITYTSVLHADTSPLIVAPDHLATEQAIAASGLPYTFLRHPWYTENYEQTIRAAAGSGVITGSAGDGRVASATRADLAAAAAAVLTAAPRPGVIHELAGDTAWSFPELAAEIARHTGTEVTYRDVTPEEHRAALVAEGVPGPLADVYVSFDRDIRRGALTESSATLRELIGRPTTTLRDYVAATL